jgi:hypothetical protein
VNVAQTVSMIKHRFAGRDEAIERAFESSESFRGLCRDYLACATVLTRWRASDAADAPARAEEYAGLLSELAGEIRMRLRAEEGPRSRQPSNGGL